MKNKYFIFTRSRVGLDNRVWLTMLIVLLVSVFILSFKLITHVNCSIDEIATSGIRQQTDNIFYVGEIITFSIPDKSDNNLQWNFNDGTDAVNGGKIIQHNFFKEGNFTVTCLMDNKCQQSLLVNIIATPSKPKDTTLYEGAPIIGMDTVNAGITAHYSTLIKANYSYQWSTSASPDIQTNAGADFTFYKEGLQMLSLKIDGTKTYTKTILVLPKKSFSTNGNSGADILPAKPIAIPPAVNFIEPSSASANTNVTINGSWFTSAKFVSFGGIPGKIISVTPTQIIAEVGNGATGPVVVTTDNGSVSFTNPPFTYIAPVVTSSATSQATSSPSAKTKITDAMLGKMLVKVVNNEWHADNFNQYFCSGVNTLVYVNTDSKSMSFADFCKSIQGKKIENLTAHIVLDPSNPNCEMNIKVNYKESKGILQKIFNGKKKN